MKVENVEDQYEMNKYMNSRTHDGLNCTCHCFWKVFVPLPKKKSPNHKEICVHIDFKLSIWMLARFLFVSFDQQSVSPELCFTDRMVFVLM